jgi:Helix-turn-helix domain
VSVSFRLGWTLAVRDDPRLPSFDKHFALTLATWMDEDGFCYPGIETIARAMGVHERTLQRHLNSGELPLVVLGYLVWFRGGGRRRTHEFRALMPIETPAEGHRFERAAIFGQDATVSLETPAARPETPAEWHPNSSEPSTTASEEEGVVDQLVGEGTLPDLRQRDLFRGAA